MSQNAENYFTYDVSHKKSATPNKKFPSSADSKTGWSVWAVEQLSGAISGGARALVRQLTTTGFRPISKYEFSYPCSQSVDKVKMSFKFSLAFATPYLFWILFPVATLLCVTLVFCQLILYLYFPLNCYLFLSHIISWFFKN